MKGMHKYRGQVIKLITSFVRPFSEIFVFHRTVELSVTPLYGGLMCVYLHQITLDSEHV